MTDHGGEQPLQAQQKQHHHIPLRGKLLNLKHKIGKIENVINPNHRHDEAHEHVTDEKRAAICDGHRFGSFAPERQGNKVKWYVDGRDYFYAVSVALERAKETIYIADWWLSPELFLRRPPYYHQEWRLDQVLKRRAEAGVQIYVSVYKEVTAAITCNSEHTKHALQGLCPKGTPGHGNIHVIRHPDHNVFENLGDMTFYWAHHEKFIVIDYALAFIGGLDLCFGRWDNHQHSLADAHPAGVEHEIWPGQDWNNNRIRDFQDVRDWQSNELSKADYGRMPWHDVAMGVIGDCVYDIAEHFVLRWNFVKRDKYKRDPRFDWLLLEGRTGEHEDLVGVQRPKFPVGKYIQHPLSALSTKPWANSHQGTVHAQVVRSSSDWSSGILTEASIQEAYFEIISTAQHYVYIENQFFITATGTEQAPIHNTIGRAIVNAVVKASKEGRKFRVIILIPAIPGFAGDLRDDAAAGTRAIMDYQYKSIHRGEHSIFEQIRKEGVDPEKHVFFFSLRSFDRLRKTPGLRKREKESGISYQQVQRANAEEIMSTAQHGAIDRTESHDDREPGSEEKMQQALKDKEKFNSIAVDEDPDPRGDSIAPCAMLNGVKVSEMDMEGDEDIQRENFVQEELYIHGKICIVDDRVIICGSSNINDRSQLGIHDSECSIVLEDTDSLETTMDGKPFKAAKLAATLRRHLWREHLGLLPPQNMHGEDDDPNCQPPDVCGNAYHEGPEDKFVADPLSDDLWNMWTQNATQNTKVFRYLFRADPDDNIRNFEQYDKFLPRKNVKMGHLHDPYVPIEMVRSELDKIKGHLVWFPLHFLEQANMSERGLQINAYTESIYT